MEIYTIGFTQTTAEHFFSRLAAARVGRLLDVRLNNSSQLAGFAKSKDLPYFLRELVGATYEHDPRLAPTQQLLDSYKKQKGDWVAYERQVPRADVRASYRGCPDPLGLRHADRAAVSEAASERCHRRLVCDYLATRWPDVHAIHL